MAGGKTARILTNSVAYRTLCQIVRESTTYRLTYTLVAAIRDVILGSLLVGFLRKRILPLFVVNDYLATPLSLENHLLEGSHTWTSLRKLIRPDKISIQRFQLYSIAESSRIVGAFSKTRRPSDSNPRRKTMAFLTLFLMLFYVLRQCVLLIFPAASMSIGWADGLVLGLLLASLFLHFSSDEEWDD